MTEESLRALPAVAGLWPLGSLASGLEAFRERRALRAARRSADAELLASATPSLRLSWRAAELVVPKRRLDLSRTFRALVRGSSAGYLPNAEVYNRAAVRASALELLEIADRLAVLERPVAPRGILELERLLVDSSGPLYDRDLVGELPVYLEHARASLEPAR